MGLIAKIKAEVEKKTHGEQGYSSGDAECGYRDCARDILSFLNTIETKEVDIEKEVIDWWNAHYSSKAYTFEGYTGHYLENSTLIEFAKHFYELGQVKGE